MISREHIEQRIRNFRKAMKDHQLPITPQKLSIFQFLASTESHPTAHEIWDKMKYYFENISFATVYKNLKKFKELNLIKEIEMKSGTVRYDANMGSHHHIINLDSGEVLDISREEVGKMNIPEKISEFELEEVSVNFFVRDKQLSRFERLKQQRTENGLRDHAFTS